jgi:hypothetical protein
MNNSVEIFIEYLLDTETTSEILFSDDLLKKDILCHKKYLPDFEQLIDNKLKQWKNLEQKDQHTTDDAVKVSDSESELESDLESRKETSFENENKEQVRLKSDINIKILIFMLI